MNRRPKHGRLIIRPAIAALVAVAAALALIGVAVATTITVDGNGSDWPPAAQVATDGNEGTIPDDTDISRVLFTNNTTTMFWRFDTYDNTRWTPEGLGSPPYALICMDTDNDTLTGVTISQCNNQSGVDYALRIDGNADGVPTITLQDCTSGSCSAKAGTLAVASATKVTEASVLLSDIGIDGTNCGAGCSIPSAVYFDNQDIFDDDRVPDTGMFVADIPGFTAITLTSLTAEADNSSAPLLLAGSLAVLAGLGLFTWFSRRRSA